MMRKALTVAAALVAITAGTIVYREVQTDHDFLIAMFAWSCGAACAHWQRDMDGLKE
jgi:hypothetical protein